MRRMTNLRTVPEPATRILEKVLHDDLLVDVGRSSKADTNARIAEIINKMEREQMEDVLGSLAEVRPKEAEALRGMLFSFEDIIKLDRKLESTSVRQSPDRAGGACFEGNGR